MLDIQKLDVYYGESRILRELDFTLRKGAITAVMGRNGVGKTTLLKAIIGLLPARSGNITFEGASLNSLGPDRRARMGIAYVPQGREIFPKLTVYENLVLGLEARRDGVKKLPEDEVYELFPILSQMRKRSGGNLSGGQQQQLAIARALVGDPKILLLDEPTEGIQPSIIQEIGKVLEKLQKRGNISIILVEQYLDFARSLAETFYIMDRGSVVLKGPMGQLSEDQIKKFLAF